MNQQLSGQLNIFDELKRQVLRSEKKCGPDCNFYSARTKEPCQMKEKVLKLTGQAPDKSNCKWKITNEDRF